MVVGVGGVVMYRLAWLVVLSVCSGTLGTVWYTLDGYCATIKALYSKGFTVSGTVGTHFSQTYNI